MARHDADLDRLATLSSADLRSQWARLTSSPVPRISPALLRLALAWELQARSEGGLSRQTTRTLDQLAAAKTRTAPVRAGMRLVREWGGQAHVVTVEGGGRDAPELIRWDGRSWRSLSEVARAITGTRWSGPAFFGLKKKVASGFDRSRVGAEMPARPATSLRAFGPQGLSDDARKTHRPISCQCAANTCADRT